VQGNYAYVLGTGGNGTGIIGLTLTIFNVSNPANPYYVSYITTGTVPWTSGNSYLNGSYIAAINGNYLYIASTGSSYLYIVNVSNPAAPFNVSGLLISGSPGSLYGISYSNGYVYLATQNKGLTVVNVSNPAAPVQTFQEGGTTNKSIGVFVSGGYIYTTNFQTTAPWTVRYLKIWTMTNPAAPVLIETYTLLPGTKPAEVVVYNNIAFVSDLNTNSIEMINVANPTAPVYLASLQASANFDVTNAANVVVVDDKYAYVTSGANATYGGAIDFYDISNPSAPILVSTYKQGVPNSLFTGSTLYNNLLYVANYGVSPAYNGSLQIFSTQTSNNGPIPSQNLWAISGQIESTLSTASGTFVLQASDDDINPTNWTDITTPTTVSGVGTFLIPKTDLCYQWVQFAYTNTGTGGLNVVLKALGGD
jgi:hypothetical protein